jgi:two-component system cell cycle response regulator
MRIMVVEDDAVSRHILQATVVQLGHQCLMARDGAQAWELFQHTEVDVVISDRCMPGIDGIELCRRMRRIARGGYTYIIFLTALGAKADMLDGIAAGADDYLTKPLAPPELEVRLFVAARITALYRQLADQKAELERLNTRLFAQARSDPLTQLGNRLRLQEDLDLLSKWGDRYGYTYCAVMCDVDCFKAYNDHYGHLAGDEVLRAVARTIAEQCRGGDLIYRYGGEEFLLLLPEQRSAAGAILAERLRQSVESLTLPHAAKTPPGVVTLSAGVAELNPSAEQDFQVGLRNADSALYQAKLSGRNRVVIYDDASTLANDIPWKHDKIERLEDRACPIRVQS